MLMDYSNSLFFLEQSKSLSKILSFQHILNFYQAGLLSLGKHLWDCLSNWELTLTNWQSNIRCECTLLYYGTEKRFLRVHWIFVWVQPILLNLILCKSTMVIVLLFSCLPYFFQKTPEISHYLLRRIKSLVTAEEILT